MITVNYQLFIQCMFALWVAGGVVNIAVGAIETDTKKQATLILSGIIMLLIVFACMVV